MIVDLDRAARQADFQQLIAGCRARPDSADLEEYIKVLCGHNYRELLIKMSYLTPKVISKGLPSLKQMAQSQANLGNSTMMGLVTALEALFPISGPTQG